MYGTEYRRRMSRVAWTKTNSAKCMHTARSYSVGSRQEMPYVLQFKIDVRTCLTSSSYNFSTFHLEFVRTSDETHSTKHKHQLAIDGQVARVDA
jgi:hypothetical protein